MVGWSKQEAGLGFFELGAGYQEGLGRKFVLALGWQRIFYRLQVARECAGIGVGCSSEITDGAGYIVLVIVGWD